MRTMPSTKATINSQRRQLIPLEDLQPDSPTTLEDRADSSSSSRILPSFAHLKHKTHQLLYENVGDDKSPKGSVDVLIRPLVDLLNKHPSFSTLSSCSGRISLFDPNGRTATTTEEQGKADDTDEPFLDILPASTNTSSTTTSSGKGHGGWWLVSHDPIDDPHALVNCLEEHSSSHHHAYHQLLNGEEDKGGDGTTTTTSTILAPLVFKVEPLLLHIAAACLTRGQQLLSLALAAGFRESGLVVSEKRVTVAIRTHSLALTVPLSCRGELRPSDSYLDALLQEANQRMHLNQSHMNKLYDKIQTHLFVHAPPSLTRQQQQQQFSLRHHVSISSELPPLQLWGCAAVAIPYHHPSSSSNHTQAKDEPNSVDILVFGGYGRGPEVNTTSNSSSQRSSHVYRLPRRNAEWGDKWSVVQVVNTPSAATTTTNNNNNNNNNNGLKLEFCAFPACQGVEACLLGEQMQMVVLFGGRTSPTNALGDLYLYNNDHLSFYKPTQHHVKGCPPPCPRWGHSLTALDKSRAVVWGGCNEKGVIVNTDFFMLSLTVSNTDYTTTVAADTTDQQKMSRYQLTWERISIDDGSTLSSLPPRFHHSSFAMDDSTLFIFGGLKSTTAILEPFDNSNNNQDAWTCRFEFSETESIQANILPIKKSVGKHILSSRFGAAGCSLSPSCNTDNNNNNNNNDASLQTPSNTIILTGGCQINNDSSSYPIQFLEGNTITSISTTLDGMKGAQVNLGSLVHHCCLPISASEFVLVGGGVSSFAFGDVFARHVFHFGTCASFCICCLLRTAPSYRVSHFLFNCLIFISDRIVPR
jgi:tRNA wybutosine-synthesizing protein 3